MKLILLVLCAACSLGGKRPNYQYFVLGTHPPAHAADRPYAVSIRQITLPAYLDREEMATRFAAEQQVVLVVKGHQSLVTDGRQIYRNTTGNPGMATGGTGDVLTGLIAALMAQGLSPFGAAQFGAYLHGAAGDLAAQQKGQVALIATDLLEALSCPATWK